MASRLPSVRFDRIRHLFLLILFIALAIALVRPRRVRAAPSTVARTALCRAAEASRSCRKGSSFSSLSPPGAGRCFFLPPTASPPQQPDSNMSAATRNDETVFQQGSLCSSASTLATMKPAGRRPRMQSWCLRHTPRLTLAPQRRSRFQ